MAAYTLPEGFSDFDMFAFGTALLVGGVLGLFMNTLTVLSYLRVKELRTPSNFFVFNLALADISLSVNALVAAYASYLRYWPYGQSGCTNHAFQGMVSVLSSISFMAAVAWDRYHQYCTRQKLFWGTSMTMSAIVWVLSIFWSALPLTGWAQYGFEPMGTCCTLDYTKGDRDYVTYFSTLATLYLLFPCITLISSYSTIYRYFKKIHHQKFNTSTPLRMLLLCWGPYALLCTYACIGDTSVVPAKLRMLLPVLAKTNPFFNAIFYAFGNEFYREGLWHFLTGHKMSDPIAKKVR